MTGVGILILLQDFIEGGGIMIKSLIPCTKLFSLTFHFPIKYFSIDRILFLPYICRYCRDANLSVELWAQDLELREAVGQLGIRG